MIVSTLKKIIRKEYLRSILVPLVMIEIMLLIAYFWSNKYVSDATQKTLVAETKINIAEISKRTAGLINLEFENIASITKIYADEHERFFNQYNPLHVMDSNENYFQTSDNVITNKKDIDSRCTLFYSSVLKETPNRMQKAIATESLDTFYNSILNSNKNITQVYFNSHDSMNRLCPYMEDALGQYPHDIDIPQYNFYYLADPINNPKKEVVWTEAYLDPAGQGWMISAIAPVYKKNFLEGVVGIDVTIDKLITNMLSIKLPYKSSAMLVDQNGNILAMDASLEPLLGIKELKKHDYEKPVTTTISKPKDFSLFKNNNNKLSQFLAKSIKNGTLVSEFHGDKNNYLLTQNSIEQTGWRLLLLLDEDSLLASSNSLKNKAFLIGFFAVGIMIIFYIVFLAWVLRRAQLFSQTILKPVNELINATYEMKDSLSQSPLSETPIEEFNKLLDNFSSMSKKLQDTYQTMDTKIKDGIKENREKDKHILQQSRQAQMGEMISMIAHQWRQPLSAISTVIASLKLKQVLNKFDLSTEEGRNEHNKNLAISFEKVDDYVKFLTSTIDDFRNFFKPDKQKESVYLIDLVNKTITIIQKAFEVNKIDIEISHTSENKVFTYGNEVMQVILNILKNAEDIVKEKEINSAKINIRIYSDNDNEVIEIEDNAGGIPEDIIDQIFDPYFSTKEEKNGSGLGLYMSKTIIEDHCGGTISVLNNNTGATFKITLEREK